MKKIQLFTLLAASAVLVACGNGNNPAGSSANTNWTEVSMAQYAAKATAVPDVAPTTNASAHVVTTGNTSITGEGEGWEQYASMMESSAGSSENTDVTYTYVYVEDRAAYVAEPMSNEASALSGNLSQFNKQSYYDTMAREMSSAESASGTEGTNMTYHFYTSDAGFKMSTNMEMVGSSSSGQTMTMTAEIIFDTNLYAVSMVSDTTVIMDMDLGAMGVPDGPVLHINSVSHTEVTFSHYNA